MIPTNEFVTDICGRMSNVLDQYQLERLRNVLYLSFQDCVIDKPEREIVPYEARENEWYVKKFLVAKQVAGLTPKSLRAYSAALRRIILEYFEKKVTEITPDDILVYFAKRDIESRANKVTQDTERRILSSFFNWCRDEEYIQRNPVQRMPKIKVPKRQKPAFTEMEIEQLRNACEYARESAAIETLLSTGCRVSELVELKVDVVGEESAVILGKGQKERTVYFNAKAQLAIKKYVSERHDNNPYLFPKRASVYSSAWNAHVGIRDGGWYKHANCIDPSGAMDKSSMEALVRKIGAKAGLPKGSVYPHKFRRTCATMALRRGMPVVQVSKMLGHASLEVTQLYLDVADEEVAQAHRKYVV